MNKFQYFIGLMLITLASAPAAARDFVGSVNKDNGTGGKPDPNVFRANCTESRAETEIDINNVRLRLRAGGDMWWDGNQARYVVPKIDPASNEPEVSSLFAGAVWLGAYTTGGDLILAAQTYRSSGNDFWTGPLNPNTGQIERADCQKWDKHFTVAGADIDALRGDFLQDGKVDNQPSRGLLGWPARGNQYFFDIHGFELPDQDLAPFIDVDGDGLYNPYSGDHPYIEVTGCPRNDYSNPVYGDEMVWWVYNDRGNIHTQSDGQPMSMEVQVTAFAYNTTDAINNMSFYRYKLLNRNTETLLNTYFSLWSDPDLGCSDNDFIGVDTLTGMGYVYNSDPNDGVTCGQAGQAGYGSVVPALGVDYFRGPLDSAGNQIGLSSFQYFVNDASDPTGDPNSALGYYRLMSGFWPDGTPVTYGNNGYNGSGGTQIPYVFPSRPNDTDPAAWSMCSGGSINGNDYRFMHTSGPFTLKPGATNEMISGVVWVPEIPDYPCPSLTPLFDADQLAQNLFDDCFKIIDGPDAPYMDIVELENELILNLAYAPSQNNYEYKYEESPAELGGRSDSTYNFQGFKIYQVADPNVSVTELDDAARARLIYQVDYQDSISKIVNWTTFPDEDVDAFIPEIKVNGENEGIRTSFVVNIDQFADDVNILVNNRPYYFCVVAYAHNEFEPYNPQTNSGQATPYLQGRRNFNVYTAYPRKTGPEYFGLELNSKFGDGPRITRIDGEGSGRNLFLEFADREAVEEEILSTGKADRIEYANGRGPVDVKVVDPLRIVNGTYDLFIYDENYKWDTTRVTQGDLEIDVYSPNLTTTPVANSLGNELHWLLQNQDNPNEQWVSYQDISLTIEQYIPELGLSLAIQQSNLPGSSPTTDASNGFVDATVEYPSGTAPWFLGVQDAAGSVINNYMKTSNGETFLDRDPNQTYSEVEGGWHPAAFADPTYRSDATGPLYYVSTNYISDNGQFNFNQTFISSGVALAGLNNVNVVLTPDKDKWSRAVVLETASRYYTDPAALDLTAASGYEHMQWKRNEPSVDKDGNVEAGSTGFSWFPGYAYDVTTGERLNIFFGENSIYNGSVLPESLFPGAATGNDMIFNPSSLAFAVGSDGGLGASSLDELNSFLGSQNATAMLAAVLGGQHMIYVSTTPYDECQTVANHIRSTPTAINMPEWFNVLRKNRPLTERQLGVSWATMALLTEGTSMQGPKRNVPPSEAIFKLRVERPYNAYEATGENNNYPRYEFKLDGLAPNKQVAAKAEEALDFINIVPNPYYGASPYEVTEIDNIVRITNLPPSCDIRIYSLDGRFVRSFNYNQQYTSSDAAGGPIRLGFEQYENAEEQVRTFQDWDLKNQQGVPVGSGIYLIHVKVPGVGERVLKSFIMQREFDSQRL